MAVHANSVRVMLYISHILAYIMRVCVCVCVNVRRRSEEQFQLAGRRTSASSGFDGRGNLESGRGWEKLREQPVRTNSRQNESLFRSHRTQNFVLTEISF